MKQRWMFFWNSLAFSLIQQMLAIWSLVPLLFLHLPCTSESSRFTYCINTSKLRLKKKKKKLKNSCYSWGIFSPWPNSNEAPLISQLSPCLCLYYTILTRILLSLCSQDLPPSISDHLLYLINFFTLQHLSGGSQASWPAFSMPLLGSF